MQNKRGKATMSLRYKAEKKLAQSSESTTKIKENTPEKLIHELQVHQIELEMQNEELRTAHLTSEESRNKYIDLYDFAPIGYFTFTRDAIIKEVNLTGASLLGIERKKLVNTRFTCFIAPEFLEKWDRYLTNMFVTGEKHICELQIRRKDDSMFKAQLESICMVMDGTLMVRTMVSDITERKKLEAELMESKRIAETLIETVPTCVKLLAADGTLQRMNRAGLDMIQVESLDQVQGQCVYPLVAEEDRAAFKALAQDVFQGKSRTLEFRMIGLKGQPRTLYTHAVPLRNNNGEIVSALSVTVDITERNKDEQERERLIAELREALANVKTLRGMIPICSYCKKIRDDKGYWQQVADYMSLHSEAEFSHGACPECAGKAMKELEDYQKKHGH